MAVEVCPVVRYLYGSRVDSRTHAMLAEAERQSGSEVIVTQGSWSDGANSAGTHGGAGAADLRTWHLSDAGKTALVNWLRRVGAAAWLRYTWQGSWGEHIHSISIDEDDLSPAARQQVTAYVNGRDGLAANRADYHWRPSPIPTWETYQGGQTLPDTGEPEDDDMPYTPTQIKAMFKEALGEALKPDTGDTDVRNGIVLLFQDVVLKDPDVRREIATSVLDYRNPGVARTEGRSLFQILLDTEGAVS